MWGLRTWILDQTAWVQILAPKLTSCMALVKFLNPTIPLFCLWEEEAYNTYIAQRVM